MFRRRLFVGFSTDPQSLADHRSWTLSDIQLVKRDIQNHLMTRKGERVMMPEFGSIIWDYLMEPLTEANKEIIVDDITKIVNSDSRVIAEQIDVVEIEFGLVVSITLYYRPWEVYESFSIEFDRKAQEQV